MFNELLLGNGRVDVSRISFEVLLSLFNVGLIVLTLPFGSILLMRGFVSSLLINLLLEVASNLRALLAVNGFGRSTSFQK